MGIPHSLQDANWNVTIPAGLWKGMSPPVELEHKALWVIKQFNFNMQAA
jgi:hypothetical protein